MQKTFAARPWDAPIPPRVQVTDVIVSDTLVGIRFNASMAERAWTEEHRVKMESEIRRILTGKTPADAQIRLSIEDMDFQEYVTSRAGVQRRQLERTAAVAQPEHPLVRNTDYPGPPPVRGLLGRHLVIAASHGWTYSNNARRWEYQRCRLFTTVEDLYTMSYANPFLMPMLERAGAVVFSERERDFQTAEVIVDNDGAMKPSEFRTLGTWTSTTEGTGWRGGLPHPLAETTEPFRLGTALQAQVAPADSPTSTAAVYVPFFPRPGRYAVYVSWTSSADHSPAVPVSVHHAGGSTRFLVNQQMGGNTWIFLGFFEFKAGATESTGCVVIHATGAEISSAARAGGRPTLVSADAVRFGGGMGNIAPEGLVSYHPRYAESARYWTQYAGAPADLVYLHDVEGGRFGVDYDRDVITRPEWINYLHGAPNGPNKDTSHPGLGVPIDAALAWHTDAGISPNGLIGTLSIYRIRDHRGQDNFPDGRSRWLNRDLAALVQEEISRAAEGNFTSTWRRRQLMHGNYGEARRPNVPTMLLELLSHQNFNDMKYGNDPRFKRDISRAIYKAYLRFLAYSYGYDPVISPLPPTHLYARHIGNGSAELTWRIQPDPLEPTAYPDGFIVYQSLDGKAFDNGHYTAEARLVVNSLAADTSYFFRVTAANTGGESFPTPVVALRWSEGKKTALLVDGFDRICGPAVVEGGSVRGFDRAIDPGVGYEYTYGLAGNQYDLNPQSPFLTNDQPGWGATEGDWEDRLERGNTFDHSIAHAEMLAAAGFAFDGATADAFCVMEPTLSYALIDWIAGRQRATPPPAGMDGVGKPDRMKTEFEVFPAAARQRLQAHFAREGKLILSGAYAIEDLTRGAAADDDSRRFAREWLGVAGSQSRATTANAVRPVEDIPAFKGLQSFRFGRDLEQTVYAVESAEAPEPGGPETRIVFRYGDTGLPAVVANIRVITAGFPLETVLPEKSRVELMKAFVTWLDKAN